MATVFDQSYSHFYTNHCFGTFFKGTLNWFSDIFYPRINYKVIGSYSRCVEYFNKKIEHGKEIDKNILPSITLNPDLNFAPDERDGIFPWQMENMNAGLVKTLYEPLPGTENSHIRIYPCFRTFKGNFEIAFWLRSIYEYFDYRTYMFAFIGKYNKEIRPTEFESFMIIPEDLYNYTTPTGEKIEWQNTDLQVTKIDATGNFSKTFPVNLSPIFRVTDMSDGSNAYHNDDITEYKLVVNCEFEIDIPMYFLVVPYCGNIVVNTNITMDSVYTRYKNIVTTNNISLDRVLGKNIHINVGGDQQSYTLVNKQFKKRAYYTFTINDETDWQANTLFTIPKPFDDEITSSNMKVTSYNGLLNYGDGWIINEDGSISVNIEPMDSEVVEFYLYE